MRSPCQLTTRLFDGLKPFDSPLNIDPLEANSINFKNKLKHVKKIKKKMIV